MESGMRLVRCLVLALEWIHLREPTSTTLNRLGFQRISASWLLPVLIVLLTACAEDGVDVNQGPIIGTVTLGGCGLNPEMVASHTFLKGRVLRDGTAYAAFVDSITDLSFCADSASIDFDKYDVLLLPVMANGCEMSVERLLSLDFDARSALYEVVVSSHGCCSGSIMNTNAVLVEEFPPDFSVTFRSRHSWLNWLH